MRQIKIKDNACKITAESANDISTVNEFAIKALASIQMIFLNAEQNDPKLDEVVEIIGTAVDNIEHLYNTGDCNELY